MDVHAIENSLRCGVGCGMRMGVRETLVSRSEYMRLMSGWK